MFILLFSRFMFIIKLEVIPVLNARDTFQINLHHAMDERGVSQLSLAEHLGVTSSTASDWYNGKKYPRPDKMQKIADFLGVTMSWLTTGDVNGFVVFDGGQRFAEKYAALDAHGRAVIDAIMTLEEKRMEEEYEKEN